MTNVGRGPKIHLYVFGNSKIFVTDLSIVYIYLNPSELYHHKKAHPERKQALLRVYNNIVTTVSQGNGSFLVLLDLSAAFDTIDHDNLFYK